MRHRARLLIARKLKLIGDAVEAERVRAVRDALPHVWLAVDANQARTKRSLFEARAKLLEQPFPVGWESLLEALQSPVAIAADESVQGLADIPGLVGASME